MRFHCSVRLSLQMSSRRLDQNVDPSRTIPENTLTFCGLDAIMRAAPVSYTEGVTYTNPGASNGLSRHALAHFRGGSEEEIGAWNPMKVAKGAVRKTGVIRVKDATFEKEYARLHQYVLIHTWLTDTPAPDVPGDAGREAKIFIVESMRKKVVGFYDELKHDHGFRDRVGKESMLTDWNTLIDLRDTKIQNKVKELWNSMTGR